MAKQGPREAFRMRILRLYVHVYPRQTLPKSTCHFKTTVFFLFLSQTVFFY